MIIGFFHFSLFAWRTRGLSIIPKLRHGTLAQLRGIDGSHGWRTLLHTPTAAVGRAAGRAKRDGGSERKMTGGRLRNAKARSYSSSGGERSRSADVSPLFPLRGRGLSRRLPILGRGAVKGAYGGGEGAQGMQVVDSHLLIHARARNRAAAFINARAVETSVVV